MVIQSCLMLHDHETLATETGWQVAELKGLSGTLRPSIDLDASTNEEGQTVDDTRNTEKLAITFDNMCEHASNQDDFLVMFFFYSLHIASVFEIAQSEP